MLSRKCLVIYSTLGGGEVCKWEVCYLVIFKWITWQ